MKGLAKELQYGKCQESAKSASNIDGLKDSVTEDCVMSPLLLVRQ